MSAGDRLLCYLRGARAAIEATGLVEDVRVHLDAFGLEDLLKEATRKPAARLIFALGKPAERTDGGFDLAVHFVIAVLAGRTGRADPVLASADASALTIALDMVAALQTDPYFDQARVAPAVPTGVKVALSEKSSKEGVAIVLIEYRAALLGGAPAWDAVAAAISGAEPSTAVVRTAGVIVAPEPTS